jgi:hypothetical protein
MTDGIGGYCADTTTGGVDCWGINYMEPANNGSDTGYSTTAVAVPDFLRENSLSGSLLRTLPTRAWA